MPSYRLTEPAREDLLELALFIAHDHPIAADRITDEIEAALRGLAATPAKGQSRQDLTADPTLRFWSVRHFLVVYRANSRPLEVLRILHGSRDAKEELKSE